MALKMKNVNIMGVHQFLGEGSQKKKAIFMGRSQKNNIYGELPKKGGAWTICRGLGKKQGGGCF